MRKKIDESTVLLNSIIKGIFEKKGLDVVKIDLRQLENRIADFFVICHGTSKPQVDSISYSVEDTTRKEAGEKPIRIEGLENCFWVLLDYGNIVVHVFQEEYRSFYSLESLWADAEIEKMVDEVKKEKPAKKEVKSRSKASPGKPEKKPAAKKSPKPKPKK
jgi:ribosome-associated protein